MKSIGKLLALTVLLLLATGVITLLVLTLMGQNSIEGLASTGQFFEQNRLTFTAFRLSLLAVLFWQWDGFIQWLAKKQAWDDDLRLTLLAARWRILTWFVIFEIVINQNLIGYLLN